jgi:hypothetical protein
VVVIALIIALGVGAYSGLSSNTRWRQITADNAYDLLNMYDLRVELADGSAVEAGSMVAVVENADRNGVVADAEERLRVPNQVALMVGRRSMPSTRRQVALSKTVIADSRHRSSSGTSPSTTTSRPRARSPSAAAASSTMWGMPTPPSTSW